MQTYYVIGNLNHDGRAYERGETIELGAEAATPLVDAGVVSEEAPVEPTVPENRDRVQQSPKKPKIGGKPMETGEPSVDGREEARPSDDEAEDITPGVRTSRRRALSPDVSAKDDEAPENDPSANL